MTVNDTLTRKTFEHINYLAETIGGRGSCTRAEREAGIYTANQLEALGVEQVRTEKFQAVPSTYHPFVLAFTTALVGTLLVWLIDGRIALLIGSLLNTLAAWGMLSETDISPSWMRRLLLRGESQNITGVIPATTASRKKAILCAHLDTHRTPVFYSSPTWHKLFGTLVAAGFLSMVAAAIVYGLGAVFGWVWVVWIGLALAPIILFSLILCLHADFTPHSPGANDNASGAAVVLGLGEQLVQAPLESTEVWLLFTGCEEVGAYGIQAFLDRHAGELDNDSVFIVLDEVGFGCLKILAADGILRKHQAHPQALELARRAAAALPEIEVQEKTGIAYTDALAATKRGYIALSIGTHSDGHEGEVSHWHQMSDTVKTIHPETLEQVHLFTWRILAEIDQWLPVLNKNSSMENHA